jgi:hypothetical protein
MACYSTIRHHLSVHEFHDVLLVAFTATLYNKIFLGYQPCQLVKRRKSQRFKDHLYPRLQGTDVMMLRSFVTEAILVFQ